MKTTKALKKNSDFGHVFKAGKAKGSFTLVVFVVPNKIGQNRLGITVSKKMGKAVVRNKLRRRIKEAFRVFENELSLGHDIVILPKEGLVDASFIEIQKTLKYLMKKQGLLNG
ncbi:MAG: ribonuclease P protein component [Defluviitaleaceae bacterium]|nr:ribonuclease P protein component [Defluviitaleaceae bacterium]